MISHQNSENKVEIYHSIFALKVRTDHKKNSLIITEAYTIKLNMYDWMD
ncbi:hypothetical protein [Chryseobacterium luteum]|nr:hypothetical protein [Chryseobacterium luteum]